MEQTARRQEQLPGAFNGATTNSQHGRVRWYLVHTPHGKERETCEKVRRIIPHNLMQDAFVMQKEFWFKRDGAWSLQTKPMYKEYFFVATRDVAMLDKALAQLSFGCRIAGSRERAYMPMPDAHRTGTQRSGRRRRSAQQRRAHRRRCVAHRTGALGGARGPCKEDRPS